MILMWLVICQIESGCVVMPEKYTQDECQQIAASLRIDRTTTTWIKDHRKAFCVKSGESE